MLSLIGRVCRGLIVLEPGLQFSLQTTIRHRLYHPTIGLYFRHSYAMNYNVFNRFFLFNHIQLTTFLQLEDKVVLHIYDMARTIAFASKPRQLQFTVLMFFDFFSANNLQCFIYIM
jgi:hypothetical protein